MDLRKHIAKNGNKYVLKLYDNLLKRDLYNYFENIFDCPIIYYNKFKKHLLFIKRKEVINWNIYDINFSYIME